MTHSGMITHQDKNLRRRVNRGVSECAVGCDSRGLIFKKLFSLGFVEPLLAFSYSYVNSRIFYLLFLRDNKPLLLLCSLQPATAVDVDGCAASRELQAFSAFLLS